MLKKEHIILEKFAEKPWKKFTFGEIKKLSGKKSESYIYNSLKKFVKQEILVEERIGKIILYSINVNSLKALSFVGFVAEYVASNKKYLPINDLEKISSKIPTNFFIFIITGSYAKQKQTKNSDIDIVILCDNDCEPKKIYSELRHDCELSIPKIHLYVFKEKEFLQMLLDKKENYGKEIVRNNLIFFGGEPYYKIISEAIKNGFNG
ncbi:MAG: nucleotidyltransferase domain-containing protein [Nanoarchaeota archaeon]|nr:nucleotidyltransferase domain-containing protein [Nanoarchaeota archaeon]